MKKKLKVGFDLDGVILYNPARLVRPLVSLMKDYGLIKRKQLQFYHPKTKVEREFWRLCHKTSIFVAPGFRDIKKLVDENKIEAYLITGRFSFLKHDLDKWLFKINADKIFTKHYYNRKNEQPHLFKKRMLKELDLDIFVEDNWDIVNYLHTKTKSKKTKIFWVYNFLDNKIDYQYKFPGLWKVVTELKSLVRSKK